MKTVDHKCPSCNASLKYNPKSKGWKCEYCGGTFTLNDLKKNEEKFEKEEVKVSKKNLKENEEATDFDEYNCKDCGAKIVADKNTAATFCVYCKNTAILKSRLSNKFSPSRIIPFAKTKDDAVEAFKKVGKGKFLMPKEFTLPKNIEELTGIYIPFWLYSCKISGNMEGTAKNVTSWSSGDYMYTKTDTYKVERNAEYPFVNVPTDGSVRFNDAIMNSIEPFDYTQLVPFNASYLSGFLAEKFDVEKDEAMKISLERAKTTCQDELRSTIHYTSFIESSHNCTANEEDAEYVLLPVWMVNIKYNEKFYTFAMNGETGKMIGDIPYSKKKAFLYFIILFVIITAIVALITYFC